MPEKYEKPLPLITEVARPFWEGCKKRKFLLQKCNDCGHVQHFPRDICARCWSRRIGWIEASGRGKIYTYTVVHRPALNAFVPDVPYAIGIIALDEGPWMLSNIVEADLSKLKIDAPVKVIFEDVTEDVTLPKFALLK